ncbi:hypothetical protein GCM10007108_16500 [Thermogymnomonas acidicola]|uniref:Uncharacterized protein n=1 Tax=Thermogymnomonas acidicola TaxID=399579 RepID=A0AA37FA15_9ARCH|nr:hypothetical protein GCM10007108_16500 [Thermogymnomonas acidicola]
MALALFALLPFGASHHYGSPHSGLTVVIPTTPGIELNLDREFFNLSVAQIAFVNQQSLLEANIFSEKWHVVSLGPNETVYRSMIRLVPVSAPGLGREKPFGIYLSVYINRTTVKTLIESAGNGTQRYYVNQTFSISIGATSTREIDSGMLFIRLAMYGSDDGAPMRYAEAHGFQKDTNMSLDGLSFSPPNSTSGTFLYMWNSTYSVNGVSMYARSQIVSYGQGIEQTLYFRVPQGHLELHYDPFLSVSGVNIFNSTLLNNAARLVIEYILEHSEALASGLATGTVFVGAAYALYRRSRR